MKLTTKKWPSASANLLLLLWIVSSCLLPMRHMFFALTTPDPDAVHVAVLERLGSMPQVQNPWGMFTTPLPFYRVPWTTDSRGNRRIYSELLQTPSLRHHRSRVVLTATWQDQLIGHHCLHRQPQQTVNVTLYTHPVDSDIPGAGTTDWPYFQDRQVLRDVCARFRP